MNKWAALIILFISSCSDDGRPIDEGAGRGTGEVDEKTFSVLSQEQALNRLREIHASNYAAQMLSIPEDKRKEAITSLRNAGEEPSDLSLHMTAYGPSFIGGSFFQVKPTDISPATSSGPLATSIGFMREFGMLWGITDAESVTELKSIETDGLGWTQVRFIQRYNGLEVIGASLSFSIDAEGSIRAVDGALVSNITCSTTPAFTMDEASYIALTATADQSTGCASLVIFPPYFHGRIGEPELAWKITTLDEYSLMSNRVIIDAMDGMILSIVPLRYYSLNRSLWDMNGLSYGCCDGCQCKFSSSGCWRGDFSAIEPHYTGGDSTCNPEPSPPYCSSNCHDLIWHYSGPYCLGNGDPWGEPDCAGDSLNLWNWTGDVYNYWWNTNWSGFGGRDSWDEAGGIMWTVGDAYGAAPVTGSVDVSSWTYCGELMPCDEIADYAKVNIVGSENKETVAHEYGHTLQIHDVEETVESFYYQWGAVGEYLADINKYRVTGNWDTGSCNIPNTGHWRLYKTVIADQTNKYIGDCSAYLLGQTEIDHLPDPEHPGWQYIFHGVTTTSIPLTEYEQIWYRAQKLHTTTNERYHSHRSDMVRSAQELFGTYSSQALQTFNAMDAIGTWTAEGVITQEYLIQELRPAARTITGGGEERLYVFYRKKPTSDRTIYYRYLVTGSASWSAENIFDYGTTYPIESEPVVTLRQYGSQQQLWVAWRNYNNNRIMAKYVAYSGGSWNISTAYGFNAYTVDSPAIASLNIGSPYERVYVVFRKEGDPTQLNYSYLGLSAPVPLGSSYRTDVAPSMVTYGTGSTKRLYVFFTGVEPDDDIYYGSSADGSSWSSRVNVTDMYDAVPQIVTGITQTEKPLALGVYGLTQSRIHVASLTINPLYETWMYSLYETSPGVLSLYGQWAVPQRKSPGWAASAGAFARSGDRLGHFFVEKYFFYWSQRGD